MSRAYFAFFLHISAYVLHGAPAALAAQDGPELPVLADPAPAGLLDWLDPIPFAEPGLEATEPEDLEPDGEDLLEPPDPVPVQAMEAAGLEG